MNCDDVRKTLTEAGPGSDTLDRHVAGCVACAGYKRRLNALRQAFREHHGEVEPDPGFATRVTARLEKQPAEVLGWAALRLLPATLALLLVLAWLSLQPSTEPVQDRVTPDTTDEFLAWVIDPNGVEP